MPDTESPFVPDEPEDGSNPSQSSETVPTHPPLQARPADVVVGSQRTNNPYSSPLTGTRRYAPRNTADLYRSKRSRHLRICLFLFVATCISTTLVGSGFRPLFMLRGFFDQELQAKMVAGFEQWDPSPPGQVKSFQQRYWEGVFLGLTYSGPLMLILLCHEMGHFLQAVRYRVPASFPFFIPLPIPPLGTMGAVIAQSRGAADRKQMFDIAVSGPLAGLAVTLPVLYFGIKGSQVDVIPPGNYLEFGEPLIIQWFVAWIHGPTPEGHTLFMNGVAQAGWVGVFVTALNLLPIGQLDGGHLTYTLLGRTAHWIAIGLVGLAAITMIYTRTFSYVLLLVLIMITGMKHPPTRNDAVPLGASRHIIGWLTLAFLLIGFTPTPIIVGQG